MNIIFEIFVLLVVLFCYLSALEDLKYYKNAYKLSQQENDYLKELIKLETNVNSKNKTTVD